MLVLPQADLRGDEDGGRARRVHLRRVRRARACPPVRVGAILRRGVTSAPVIPPHFPFQPRRVHASVRNPAPSGTPPATWPHIPPAHQRQVTVSNGTTQRP